MTCIVMHALIRHYHAFSLLRRAIRPSLPSIICSFIMHSIPSAGSSKASSQLHSDCLAPSGSSLISIPLLLFLFIAFHFLFYIITYLFRVPQGVILSILLIYFNRYCSLVSRSSNDSQTHFKFLLRKRSLLTPESLSYTAKQQVFYC